MAYHLGAEMSGNGPDHTLYLRRRVREEANAAASADSHAAAMIHAALAAAYAGRTRNAEDQSWIAANRLW